jgi:hypothetical protein
MTGEKNLPRGLRNCNPGNIRLDPGITWQGAVAGDDPDFVTFSSFVWGVRAMGKILLSYRERDGISTLRGMVTRWAPPSENNTSSYLSDMSKFVGISPDEVLPSPLDKATLLLLVRGFCWQENGRAACEGVLLTTDLTQGAALALGLPNG